MVATGGSGGGGGSSSGGGVGPGRGAHGVAVVLTVGITTPVW